MNITSIIKRYFEKAIDKYSETDTTVKLSMDMFKQGAYAALKEASRLNFPAMTIVYDNKLSKQGFTNMVLNMLIDKDDAEFGKLHFVEYKAWREDEPLSGNDNRLLIIKRADSRLDFAKFTEETHIWIDQSGNEIPKEEIKEWRYMDDEL